VAVRKNGGCSSSAQAWKGAGERSGMRGRGAGVAGARARPFIGAGGTPRRRQWVVTGGIKVLTPLMAEGG
jgi:hypothetical protein